MGTKAKRSERRNRDPWHPGRALREKQITEQLAALPIDPAPPLDLDDYRELYIASGNPVPVWDATLQVYLASVRDNVRYQVPPFVLAYLFRVAIEIMGRAVAHVSGSSRERAADEPPQLSADERLRVVLEALMFVTPNQPNALLAAHKHEVAERLEQLVRSAAGDFPIRELATRTMPKSADPEGMMRRKRKATLGRKSPGKK